MNFENYQSYIFPLIIVLFFGYRIYRFKMIKNKLPKLLDEGAILIDVRSKGEYTSGHNPKSINIPLDELNKESKKLDKTKTVLLCCASGTRSGMAVGILKKNGFNNVINAGPWSNTLS
ncbi:MAG: rhodanese-like domain-containing protein [Bacteriovorax sp.]|nr:rhodanese-like domain-containing protein [Bacteriovorax sp.]